MVNAASGRRQAFRIAVEEFHAGALAKRWKPGFYNIGRNFDGRYGIPGPREVADLTGIAAGYRIICIIKSFDIPIAVTTNSTDTRIYRKETTWVLRATISSRVATDAISFNNVIAVALGSSNPYQFATDTGSGNLSFSASTKTTADADRANYFWLQTSGVPIPRVVYTRNPNEVYWTEDLTNTDGTGVQPTFVGDYATTQQKLTSVCHDRTGRLLVGGRHDLFDVNIADGIVTNLTNEHFDDPAVDAGGQSDRDNFEGPVAVGNKIYYPLGYDIGEWDPATQKFNRYMAPRHSNPDMPRADLPVNCLAAAGGWLIAFLGSKTASTLKSVTYASGGGAHLANSFTTASEMWIGSYIGDEWIWHGILLECTNPLRGAFFDEDDSYLTMFSGDSESADLQSTRCLFYTENPLYRSTSSAVVLNNGTWEVELGVIDVGEPFLNKILEQWKCDVMGLSGTRGTNPSLELEYKITDGLDSAAFSSLATYYIGREARTGSNFRKDQTFQELHLKLVGVGTGDTYAIFKKGELRGYFETTPDRVAA